MSFFESFKLTRAKSHYRIEYRGKLLASVYKNVASSIVKDYATKAFLKDLKGLSTDVEPDASLVKQAKVMEVTYRNAKKIRYKGRKIKQVLEQSADFMHFIKAAKMANDNKVSPGIFIKAQVDGLSFIEGKPFPKVTQISTNSAEQRLFDFLGKEEVKEVEEAEKLKITKYDIETPLLDNAKFLRVYDKIKDGTASYNEAYYAYEVTFKKRGYADDVINDYLDKLEESDNE